MEERLDEEVEVLALARTGHGLTVAIARRRVSRDRLYQRRGKPE
jgi:hypothetical protein